jgi:hypothetical protein
MSLDRRILIADDDREVRSGVVDLLRDLDMDFVHAETGIQALHIVRNSVIDLALLDMPGHNGLEVLSFIRRSPELPCIFFSEMRPGDPPPGAGCAVLSKPSSRPCCAASPPSSTPPREGTEPLIVPPELPAATGSRQPVPHDLQPQLTRRLRP